MAILTTENLVKTYGTGDNAFNAVDGISMSVEQGEFVAIVGQSGTCSAVWTDPPAAVS